MIYELAPFVSTKIWGGDKLKNWKNIQNANGHIGETWEVSTHDEGQSIIKATQANLSTLVKLNYLVKYIDTNDVLSIQVHPGDEYAKIHESQKGKTECWLILAHEEGAGIYLGFKKGKTKKDLKEALAKKQNVSELLNFIEVKVGDFFFVPSGTIHAIGSGVTLVEVQQSSGVTYRVWDWDRLENGSPRTLHVDKSFDVLEDAEDKNDLSFFQYRTKLFDLINKNLELVNLNDFKLKFVSLEKGNEYNVDVEEKEFSLIVLNGDLIINDVFKASANSSLFIQNEQIFHIKAQNKSHFLIIA